MIKSLLKRVVIAILTWEAKMILKKYRPKVVGITGSVGKTSTKEAVATVLATKYDVRKSPKSYNSEFGVPLTVIGRTSAWGSLSGWLLNILAGLKPLLTKQPYPEWLVLEIGADRPGDIAGLMRWLKLDVAVVTTIPEIPVHIEFFPSKESLIAEKGAIARGLLPNGTAVLNVDDPNVAGMVGKFTAVLNAGEGKILTYGRSKDADLSASSEKILYKEDAESSMPDGITFKLDYGGKSVPVRLKGVFGTHHVYTALAALSVGVSQNLNMITMLEVLVEHETPAGRLRALPGIKGTVILDDTYNSSPAALEAALDTLDAIKCQGRKIAVIGDMMELGGYAMKVHTDIGIYAAGICDYIFTVGPRAKLVAEGAKERGFDESKLIHCSDAVDAGKKLQQLIEAGDLILVKGSQSMRMEKTVEEIMAEPERKGELLTRQYEGWVE
ncbi:MAG TPA: UDP-N-acetylmuramoyl-tripeptide--D-alanyl-D-alanine ligase [Candidatus Paceibacterota bacterium]|nr:UDP-N-acetylmuramoyl-tripeptide--D-alanyl-D-alanine ligase [Candidatus Paceibacterota bacterium]